MRDFLDVSQAKRVKQEEKVAILTTTTAITSTTSSTRHPSPKLPTHAEQSKEHPNPLLEWHQFPTMQSLESALLAAWSSVAKISGSHWNSVNVISKNTRDGQEHRAVELFRLVSGATKTCQPLLQSSKLKAWRAACEMSLDTKKFNSLEFLHWMMRCDAHIDDETTIFLVLIARAYGVHDDGSVVRTITLIFMLYVGATAQIGKTMDLQTLVDAVLLTLYLDSKWKFPEKPRKWALIKDFEHLFTPLF